MFKIPKQECTPEFKEVAVQRVSMSGKWRLNATSLEDEKQREDR